MTKALLITSFVLLGSLLAAPLTSSDNQSHIPGIIQALPASAPFDHIVTILMENQGLCSIYVGCGGCPTYISPLAKQNVLGKTLGATYYPNERNHISPIRGEKIRHNKAEYCFWGENDP